MVGAVFGLGRGGRRLWRREAAHEAETHSSAGPHGGLRAYTENPTDNVPTDPSKAGPSSVVELIYRIQLISVWSECRFQTTRTRKCGMTKTMRAAIYLRVSTEGQTVENQRRELEAVAAQRGWEIVVTFDDAGISGAKGRDMRPGLDLMLKEAIKGRFDVVMAWAVDRIGRSLPDLLDTMQELRAAGVGLFLHQQSLDTTTPAGKAMFSMLGVFAEFERSMIQARVHAGLERAKAAGVKLGRPKVSLKVEAAIREQLEAGVGMLKVAKAVGVGTAVVQRVKLAMTAPG